MFVPFLIIAFIVILMIRLVSAAKGYDPGGLILAVLPAVTILAAWFYFALMESSPWQATLGKRAVGLCVSDIEGHRLTLRRALGRNLAKCLSILECWYRLHHVRIYEEEAGVARHDRKLSGAAPPMMMIESKSWSTRLPVSRPSGSYRIVVRSF